MLTLSGYRARVYARAHSRDSWITGLSGSIRDRNNFEPENNGLREFLCSSIFQPEPLKPTPICPGLMGFEPPFQPVGKAFHRTRWEVAGLAPTFPVTEQFLRGGEHVAWERLAVHHVPGAM